MAKIKRPSQAQATLGKSQRLNEKIDARRTIRARPPRLRKKRFNAAAHIYQLLADYYYISRALKEPIPNKARPPLARLTSLTDWVPSPVIRKRQQKLLADETSEILQFRAEGRRWLAHWRLAWTWFYWFFYLLSAPFSMVTRAIRKLIV